ncbi:hypothetical protein ACLOJK_015696 [Asimina triloba]
MADVDKNIVVSTARAIEGRADCRCREWVFEKWAGASVEGRETDRDSESKRARATLITAKITGEGGNGKSHANVPFQLLSPTSAAYLQSLSLSPHWECQPHSFLFTFSPWAWRKLTTAPATKPHMYMNTIHTNTHMHHATTATTHLELAFSTLLLQPESASPRFLSLCPPPRPISLCPFKSSR